MPKGAASGPSASTMEMASWPMIWGSWVRPPLREVMSRSEWQSDATWTRTRTLRPVGVGTGTCSMTRGSPGWLGFLIS